MRLRKTLYIFLMLALLLAGFIFGLYTQKTISSRTVSEELLQNQYSYTTAICNNNRECIDIFVTCNGSNVQKLVPVSDKISFPPGWNDTRDWRGGFCTEQ